MNTAATLLAVTRTHGPDVTAYLIDNHPDALPLIADGWTIDAALDHIAGTCDRMLCTGDHDGNAR